MAVSESKNTNIRYDTSDFNEYDDPTANKLDRS